MRSEKSVKEKIAEFYELEKNNGNKNLRSSRISPRRQGKIQALKWVLGLVAYI